MGIISELDPYQLSGFDKSHVSYFNVHCIYLFVRHLDLTTRPPLVPRLATP